MRKAARVGARAGQDSYRTRGHRGRGRARGKGTRGRARGKGTRGRARGKGTRKTCMLTLCWMSCDRPGHPHKIPSTIPLIPLSPPHFHPSIFFLLSFLQPQSIVSHLLFTPIILLFKSVPHTVLQGVVRWFFYLFSKAPRMPKVMSSRKARRATSGWVVENASFEPPPPDFWRRRIFKTRIFFHIPVAVLRKKRS